MNNLENQSQSVQKRRKATWFVPPLDEKSLTIQSDTPNCCINKIMAKYRASGQIDHMKENPGQYINSASMEDFQTSMNTVSLATSMFEELPSEIRNRFDNDPAKLLHFVHDEANLEEMYTIGLAIRPPPLVVPVSTKSAEGSPEAILALTEPKAEPTNDPLGS